MLLYGLLIFPYISLILLTKRKQMKNTNWLAILAATIAGFFIGFLWYGLLFQPQWMEGNGITTSGEGDAIKMFKYGKEVAVSNVPMIANVIGMFVLALITNWILNVSNHTTAAKGLTIGAILGLIVSVNILLSNLFANNSMTLTLVDSSYIIVVLGVMGLILGAWRKKTA